MAAIPHTYLATLNAALVHSLPALMTSYQLEVVAIWLHSSLWEEESEQIAFHYLGEYIGNTHTPPGTTLVGKGSLSYLIFHLEDIGIVRLYPKVGNRIETVENLNSLKSDFQTLLEEILQKYPLSISKG